MFWAAGEETGGWKKGWFRDILTLTLLLEEVAGRRERGRETADAGRLAATAAGVG